MKATTLNARFPLISVLLPKLLLFLKSRPDRSGARRPVIPLLRHTTASSRRVLNGNNLAGRINSSGLAGLQPESVTTILPYGKNCTAAPRKYRRCLQGDRKPALSGAVR